MKKTIYNLTVFLIFHYVQVFSQDSSGVITLNECIDSAIINNPVIKEAGNEVIISAIGVKTARSDRYPVVSADGSGGYSNEYRLGNNYKIGTAKFSIDQLLWQKGKVSSSIEQSYYNNEASRASLKVRQREIILSVKIAYYTSLQQVQLYQIAVDNISKASLFLEYARERFKVGTGRKSDVLKAESDLAEAEFDRDKYQNSIQQTLNELSMLTGITVTKLSQPDDSVLNQSVANYSGQADSLVALAFQFYPELQVTKNLQQSQQAKINEVHADLYPRLSANAGYDWTYNPVLQDQYGWYAVLGLRWNLFNGNYRRYQLQSEKIRMNSYENQKNEIKQFLIKEVNNRVISLKEAENQINLTSKLMKTTSENLEIAVAQYSAGTGSMLELADARVSDLLAKQKYILAITAFRIAQAYLERLTGNNL